MVDTDMEYYAMTNVCLSEGATLASPRTEELWNGFAEAISIGKIELTHFVIRTAPIHASISVAADLGPRFFDVWIPLRKKKYRNNDYVTCRGM